MGTTFSIESMFPVLATCNFSGCSNRAPRIFNNLRVFSRQSPGSYDLSITAPGFKNQANEIVLRVALSARINVALQVGSASTQVQSPGSRLPSWSLTAQLYAVGYARSRCQRWTG